jgi:D-cysteine desulfhydrase family pyridoxal phosphate-dependent enzyme
MDKNRILARIENLPRLLMAEYPTPLDYLPRLSGEYGRDIFIKRDDYIGPGLGGNKTRKLEYLLADALRKGKKKIVTFGGLQSNHVRITAAAARKYGLEPHIFFFEHRPRLMNGNLFLNQLFDAVMHFIPFGSGESASMSLETTIRLVHIIAWAMVGPHYFIPVGGHNWLGCMGYVLAAVELIEQAKSIGIEDAYTIVAAGSGGTLAGLMAGFTLSESKLELIGIDVGKLWQGFPKSIASLANKICIRVGQSTNITLSDVPLIEKTYVGEKYGIPSIGGNEAIRLLARSEGILLDPVYTAKAFSGLLDLLRQEKLDQEKPVIFIHTGGIPALFAFSGSELD